MKIIKNETTQGFEIYLNTSQGIKSVWLSPKQKLVVEESAITTQLLTLNKRKIVRISNA
jgi:hypothetical protein